MTTNRDNILRKVRALLNKTTQNGATEAEMMAALNRAQAIMDEHDINQEELEFTKAEKADHKASEWRTDPHNIKRFLSRAIAEFAGVESWLGWINRNTKDGGKAARPIFCGLPSDVDFAIWLVDTLSFFVFSEVSRFLRENRNNMTETNRKTHIHSFVVGCTFRISDRLRSLKQASDEKATSNRNALIVIKNELIKRRMNELGLKIGKARKVRGTIEANSYEAGFAAGDRASFGRPMEGGGGVLRLK